MSAGLVTYKRLKARLDMRQITMTTFAASLGTSPQMIMDAVLRWTGRVDSPKNATTQKIMAAVEAELAEADDCTLTKVEP
jgi:hypothetical protein